MFTYEALKARFPHCYSVAGDVIARIDNANVVLATLGNGSFNLTQRGQELMGAADATETPRRARGRPPKSTSTD